jgi:hypothetical protein
VCARALVGAYGPVTKSSSKYWKLRPQAKQHNPEVADGLQHVARCAAWQRVALHCKNVEPHCKTDRSH